MKKVSLSSHQFLVALIVVFFIAMCLLFAPHFSVFILAIVFGVIFMPVNRFLRRHIKPSLAAILTTLLVIVVIMGPVAFVVGQIIHEASLIVALLQSGSTDLPEVSDLTVLQAKIDAIAPSANINLIGAIRSGLEWLVSQTGVFFSSALAVGLNLFLSIIALVYWFKDSEKMHVTILQKSPLGPTQTNDILQSLGASIHGIIKGTLVIALLQGVIAGLGFSIFGVPSAILWGSVAAISALVPTLGTAIIIVPMIAYLVIIGHFPQAIGLGVWGILAVGLIDNILGPRLMARGTTVHPFFILMGVLGGVGLMGPVGVFAGPLIISAFFVLFDVYGTTETVPEPTPVQ